MSSSAPGPGRQWIIDLVRDHYYPAPAHYRPGDRWDDGAEAIADAILAQLPLLVAEQRALAAAERWHQARCSFDEHSAARELGLAIEAMIESRKHSRTEAVEASSHLFAQRLFRSE